MAPPRACHPLPRQDCSFFNTGNNALNDLGRVSTNNDMIDDGSSGDPRIYQTLVDLGSLGYNTQHIVSITFTKPAASDSTAIFAVSGQLASDIAGACCGTAACTTSTLANCSFPNLFQGPGTACSGSACPTAVSACCNNVTNACSFVTGTTCAAGYTNQGAGSTCSPNACPTGACCNDTTGACTTGGSGCPAGSTYRGAGTTCAATSCPTGACCNDATSACSTGGSSCPAGSTYQGAGTTCSATTCPNNSCGSACGAGTVCASINGGFELNSFAGWSQFGDTGFTGTVGPFLGISPAEGQFQADFGPVGPGGIMQTISAHAGDTVTIGFWYAALSDTNSFDANFGGQDLVSFTNDTAHTTYTQVSFTVTAPTDSPVLMFTFTNPDEWDFLDGVTVCIQQSAAAGVCCRGSTCNTTVAQAGCTGSGTAGAAFVSASGTCNSGAVSNAPCCYADYNKANGITVQDIFDFLADWFAGNNFAKVGGDGSAGPLAVQNIFDFLSNWFNGGCS